MTAPICGFDIGTENCYIGIARQGGIEIILNDFSQRSTPGYVCLLDKQRELGVAAKQKQNTNLVSTFYNLRRIIGRQFHEVSNEEQLAFPIEQAENGEVAVRVYIQGEEHLLTATQLLAMVLTKLKQLSNNTSECVINCPNYFTDSQRRALKYAASIANISVSRILPDLSAVALYYCFYRVNSKEEKNQILCFIDIGASSTQCSVVEYNPKTFNIQVLALEYESNIGGRTFDEIIGNYFIKQQGLKLNKRSKIRLLCECEKLKKQMSANSNELPINIECLYNDRDFSGKMDRALFENLCQEQFNKIQNVFKRVLESATSRIKSNQENKDENITFSSIELVGGSSRIPAIKHIAKDVFGMEARSTLNADEAVALGCTLQSTLLSPNYRVAREFKVIDYQPYQINCRYWHENQPNGKVHTISPFYQRGSPFPFTRQIMFNCHSLPIIFELDYLNDLKQPADIGQFKIFSTQDLQNVTFPCKLKILVRLDNDGLVTITKASLNIEEPKDESNKDSKEEKNDKDEKAKKEAIVIPLNVETNWLRGNIDNSTLDAYKTLEMNLVLADKNWNEKIDARNELEEYIYNWRDKVESDDYQKYIDLNEKSNFSSDLKNTEKWLFEDEESGEIQSKSVYEEILTNLKIKYSDAITFRLRQAESRDSCLEKLGKSIQMGYKVIETEEQIDDLDSFKETLTNIHQYFEETHSKLSNLDLTKNPPVTIDEINEKSFDLDKKIKGIFEKIQKIRKAKEDALKKKEEENAQTANSENGVNQEGEKKENSEENKMDIDK